MTADQIKKYAQKLSKLLVKVYQTPNYQIKQLKNIRSIVIKMHHEVNLIK